MKAIIRSSYGSPDVLKCEEIEKPNAGDGEVLIKVRAASVNPLDWHFMRGAPYVARAVMGLRKPRSARLGADLAGQVEAVGRNVTQFQPGDDLFGSGRGAFAEYVCADGKRLALKPANLTFEQAAAVPVAACTAPQVLRHKGRIQPGQSVLINGAAGGIGTFAVQIAKSVGAEVTGVCSARNVDMVRAIGADQVVDYNQDNFTRSRERYDLIFDAVGNHSLSACRRVMRDKGIYVLVGGPDGRWIGPLARLVRMMVVSPFVSQDMVPFLASTNNADLAILKELIETRKVTPVIDRSYTLTEVPQAIRYLEEGHARGKVVITFESTHQR